MGITLYTSRVILQVLGVNDFGIYNIVGGIIAMFGFISGSFSSATQRYITYESGKGEKGDVSKIFSTCLYVHIIIGVIVLLISEPIGIWFVVNKAIIPPERVNAALWVYQFAILSSALVIATVPLNATIIAYEKMGAFAAISVVDAVLKLIIVFFLTFVSYDRLIVYSLLIFISQTFIQFLYIHYCKKHLRTVKLIKIWDTEKVKEIASFALWGVLGNVSYLSYTQGLSLLLSTFFAPFVNAARGIAVQVQGAVNTFVTNFQMAVNPQITKLYANGNLLEMHKLVFRSSRFSFYLLLIISLPILFETERILQVWLGKVPNYTPLFLRLILLTTWINSVANPLIISVKATGQIWRYESVVAVIMLLILPISYVFLKIGFNAYIVFIVHLSMEIIAQIARIVITSKLVKFSICEYVNEVLIRILIVVVLSTIIPFACYQTMLDSWVRFISVSAVCFISSAIVIFLAGLSNEEKLFVKNKIKQKFGKSYGHKI